MLKFSLQAAFTTPKDEPAYRNEDAFASSERKGVYAISDGASVSFDSASWSRILVRRFCQQPAPHPAWLRDAVSEFAAGHDREKMAWMEQAAFDRGSFATLLGLRDIEDTDFVKVFAVGDTIAVFCEGTHILHSFPYRSADQFDNSPTLICTNPTRNPFTLNEEFFQSRSTTWDCRGVREPVIVCMTDALGQWLLRQADQGANPVEVLNPFRTGRQFRRFVQGERRANRMRRDDATLLILRTRATAGT